MTKTTKTSIKLIIIMLATLAGFATGHQVTQTMWERAIITNLK